MSMIRIAFGAALGLGLSASALAFDCPNRFTAVEAAITKASSSAMAMPDGNQKMQVHMLLDDAKMLLAGARHNHEKPQGKMDHARSMAKADSAKAWAAAAAVLASK